MGFFRFRRRIKLFPGLWLNASKTGLSTSVGGKGLTVNYRRGKIRTTASLPGTGLSYIQTTRTHADPPQGSTGENEDQAKQGSSIPGFMLLLVIVAVIVWLVK